MLQSHSIKFPKMNMFVKGLMTIYFLHSGSVEYFSVTNLWIVHEIINVDHYVMEDLIMIDAWNY